jgi:hypothetical protein
MSEYEAGVNQHYGRPALSEIILNGLQAAGQDPANPTPEDLAPVDQFHIRGLEATLELARLAEIRADDVVLDIGGGLGGPARALASQFGCSVLSST